MSDSEQIIKVIETFFETGKTKNLAPLRDIQLDDPNFSSFSDVPPYDLKDYKTTIALEELRFVSISDYDYEITNPKISIFTDTAVVAFELLQKGLLVDNKAYTGEHISIKGSQRVLERKFETTTRRNDCSKNSKKIKRGVT